MDTMEGLIEQTPEAVLEHARKYCEGHMRRRLVLSLDEGNRFHASVCENRVYIQMALNQKVERAVLMRMGRYASIWQRYF